MNANRDTPQCAAILCASDASKLKGDKANLEDLTALPDDDIWRLIDGESSLKVWREQRNLTQAALSALSGLSEQSIVSIEEETVGMRAETRLMLAEALGVDPRALIRLVCKT